MTDAPRRIPDHMLAEIRARHPLAEIVGRHAKLERRGRQLRCRCPFHDERRPSFYIYPDHYHCFGCGCHGDVIRFVMQTEQLGFVEAVNRLSGPVGFDPQQSVAQSMPAPQRAGADEEAAARLRDYAIAIYLDAKPIADTPADRYLVGRGINLRRLGRWPNALRCHADLPHKPSGRRYPAMLAAINGSDGRHLATHRTWLRRRQDGSWGKIDDDDAKMTVGSYAGGTIRLWRGASGRPLKQAQPDEWVVLGEGIETCLSIALACPELRVLSAVSLGNLGGVALPPQARKLILAADNDVKPVARTRFQAIVERYLDAGYTVRVARSPIGSDFNDALRAWRRAA